MNQDNKGMYYIQNTNELVFCYNNVILFRNSKSIPFIVIKETKGDGSQQIALYRNNILKVKNNQYRIIFFNNNYSVNCTLTYDEVTKKVSFSIDNYNNYERIIITLNKENFQKVYGLCYYKIDSNNKKLSFIQKIISLFKKENPKFQIDDKLSFYVLGTYFFENINIYDYEYIIRDKIFIETHQKSVKFNLIFEDNINKAINQEDKNSTKFVKFTTPQIYAKLDNKYKLLNVINSKKYNGVIFNGDSNLTEYEIKTFNKELNKDNKKCLFYFSNIIKSDEYLENEYYIDENGNKKVNFDNEVAVRKFFNNIRRYLDCNIDGIYIDGDYNKKEIVLVHDYIYKMMTNEYIKNIVLHSTISEKNVDFGYYIIKNRKIIDNIDFLKSYYLYSGENRLGCEITSENEKIESDFIVKVVEL